jgi:hypothetical protein
LTESAIADNRLVSDVILCWIRSATFSRRLACYQLETWSTYCLAGALFFVLLLNLLQGAQEVAKQALATGTIFDFGTPGVSLDSLQTYLAD